MVVTVTHKVEEFLLLLVVQHRRYVGTGHHAVGGDRRKHAVDLQALVRFVIGLKQRILGTAERVVGVGKRAEHINEGAADRIEVVDVAVDVEQVLVIGVVRHAFQQGIEIDVE
ncbi:hypothetical protein D3C72_2200070 [compost metagenome]